MNTLTSITIQPTDHPKIKRYHILPVSSKNKTQTPKGNTKPPQQLPTPIKARIRSTTNSLTAGKGT